MSFEDAFYWSPDGLRLHARRYTAQTPDALTVICLPGLTRNARDFEGLAARLAGRFNILCPDLRGRGDSAYAPDPLTYAPVTYVQDVMALIFHEKLERLAFIGTSLGGILTMAMSAALGPKLKAAVLNDVGPVIEETGLARIRGYVGKVGPFPTWMHAARAIEATNRPAYPDYQIGDWLNMAKRLAYVQPNGRIVMDYDPRLAEPFKLPAGPTGGDLWPAFEGLKDTPTLAIRGGLSDIISAETLVEMQRRKPDLRTLTIPNVGHAPTLDEPASVAAIEALLSQVAESA
jgi:pimeloyl-ACP methyl ester carboxylesterase